MGNGYGGVGQNRKIKKEGEKDGQHKALKAGKQFGHK